MALTTSVVTSVIVLGVIGTGIAYVLNYRLIADEGATAASTVTYLLPIVAVLLGLAVLAEPVGWNLAAGAVIVLVGVALSEGRLGEKRRTRLAEQRTELERAP
jgi:drug/metabolite transporter (DMT)-like permease